MDMNLSYKEMPHEMPLQPDSVNGASQRGPYTKTCGIDIISTIRVVCCLLFQISMFLPLAL